MKYLNKIKKFDDLKPFVIKKDNWKKKIFIFKMKILSQNLLLFLTKKSRVEITFKN